MSSERVFLDTSGWIALLNTRDENHPDAVVAWQALAGREVLVVTTDWVLAETGNGLAGSPLRDGFSRAARHLIASPNYLLVEVDRTLLERAIDLYAARPDKAWGLVDCASFLVMGDYAINAALTADHHFEPAGFFRLLKRPGNRSTA